MASASLSPDQGNRAGGVEVVEVPTSGATMVQSLVEDANRHMDGMTSQ